MSRVILSVLGQDRPGILAAVSGALYQKNGNIENVSQTTLQSQFAGIFIASVPESVSLAEVTEALQKALDPLGMSVHLDPLDPATEAGPPVESEPFVITTKGPDRKGLVAEMTAIIARYNVNITNLQAIFKGGDNPGDNIMIYEVDIPTGISRQELHRELKEKAAALALDISIQHRNIFMAIHRI